jgi:hypothetical protein
VTLIARTCLALAATALAALLFAVAPATASPASQSAALAQVRAELKEASAALGQIWGDDYEDDDFSEDDFVDEFGDDFDDDLEDVVGDDFDDDDVSDDSESVDFAAIAANLQHTATARQVASKLRPRKLRPVALLAVAEQSDENVYEYADGIGWVEGQEQPTFLDGLDKSLEVRSAMIGGLISAAPKQAASARGKSLRTVGDLLSDGDSEILLDTLAEEDGYGATPEVKDSVVVVLAGLLNGAQETAADIRDLGSELRGNERRDPRDAAGAIESELKGLPDYVDELLSDMEDYDDPAAGTAAFCGYLAGLPLPTPAACG